MPQFAPSPSTQSPTAWARLKLAITAGAGLVGFDYALTYAASTIGKWLQDLSGVTGSTFIGFGGAATYQYGQIGAAVRDGYANALWSVGSEAERAAIKAYTSTTDHTGIINTLLGITGRVYLPAGKWNVDPAVGLVLNTGNSIIGEGLMRTIIVAADSGGTTAELTAYAKGSVIKRAFTSAAVTPGATNAYVTGCYLADFSVQLQSQTYNAANYKQIGIDLRNITRSVVERVHCGTLGIPGQSVCPVPSATDACQHYGIVLGNVSSGGTDYAGGEVNVVRDCNFWGAFKNLVIDDTTISPGSSAHGTLIDNCDIQGGHEMCVQASQYAAGVVMRNLTVQGNYRQSGNANPTIGAGMSGYNGSIHIKYAELGAACDTAFVFGSTSKNCKLDVDYWDYSGGSTGNITDSGTRNTMRYPAGIGGAATADFVETYNKAFRRVYAKFAWNGSAIVISESFGVTSVTRNSQGNYTVTLSKAMPTAHWAASVLIEADGSFHFGGACARSGSQSTTAFRFDTYSQNAGTTTAVDPTMVYFTGSIV